RHVVVNLNATQPPAWARQRSAGPLFADDSPAEEPGIGPLLDVMRHASEFIRWDWHVQGRDFASAEHRQRLQQVTRLALDGVPIALVSDSQRRPIALAEGMDRRRPAVLMEVGLDLGAFLDLPAIAGRADALRDKLPSLARMAVSAGAQKRKYLRQHADGTRL